MVELRGLPFWKMSGSGNDFVFLDDRDGALLEGMGEADVVRRVCERGTGVGADGLVFLRQSAVADYAIVYLNSDGSRASLCGNATLCSARLAATLGVVRPTGFTVETDAGVLAARLDDGLPEIDFAPVTGMRVDAGITLEPGEQRIGFALAGVPHVAVLVDEIASVDVVRRGRAIRTHPSLGTAGANANFVGRGRGGDWLIRTYERGVEGETLACGTGAVATAALLGAWDAAGRSVELRTRSDRLVRVRTTERNGATIPSLAGEGRLVYNGTLGEL